MRSKRSRFSSTVGSLYLLSHRYHMVSFSMPEMAELKSSWRDVLHVGLPAAGTNAIIPVATTLVTGMVARFGPEAVAGFGVASRVESLVLVIFYALSSIIGPFAGQNLAAGKEGRIQTSLQLTARFCMLTGFGIAVLLALSAGYVGQMFSDNPEVVGVTRLFLLIAPISYGAYGVVMVMNAAFNGLGNPMPAVYISVTRMMVLYVPMALLFQQWFGVAGIFAAYAIANIATGWLSYVWARRAAHRLCEAPATS